MNNLQLLFRFFVVLLLATLLPSCLHRESSNREGWEYNQPRNGGFQKVRYAEQEVPPGMVLIKGEIRVSIGADGLPVTDTIDDFFISKYEETNGQYCAYLDFLKKYYSDATYKAALPDTMVWWKDPRYNHRVGMVAQVYLRHPAFENYPVVGLTPEQIERYAAWKTDRINEFILRREFDCFVLICQDSTDVFRLNDYLAGNYDFPDTSTKRVQLDPKKGWSGKRKDLGQRIVRMEDGILIPAYRLPRVNEWKLAAYAIGDEYNHYVKTSEQMNVARYDKDDLFGFITVKLPRGKGPFVSPGMGISRVDDYKPNNYLVYAISEGVPEMVKDSLGYSITPNGNYAAIYQKEIREYATPNAFGPLTPFQKPSVSGFRLVVDYVDLPKGY